MTELQFPSDRGYPEPSQASTALALGIIGLFAQILAPFAWVMAQREITAIQEGRRDPVNLQTAQTARILGIVGCCVAVVGVIVIVILVSLLGFRTF
ncbi:MAG: hypothetical protein J5I28_02770 [Acidimicrobiales bacterium]|nr:hypothetical protein [Acidimicrobiales bacterium]HLV90874.1 hypothetical protein [Acidimicrobiia bacterium]